MATQKRVEINQVLAYLGENRLMTLGTVDEDNKPWSATVFFAYDQDLNLFFYSHKDTKHCQNISKNPYVSLAINHAWRNPDGTIKGLQAVGRASKVPENEYSSTYALYKSRFKWADEFAADHVIWQIKPKEIWYIDEKFFGHFRRVKVV